jgi:hypothetical protein
MTIVSRALLSHLGCAALILSLGACGDDAPITITVEEPNDTGTDLDIEGVYLIDEGQTLDLIVTSPGASLTATNLPTNASFNGGIFSFSPDFGQAGVFSVAFQDEIAGTSVVRRIGVRVNNVVYMPDVVTTVSENGTQSVTFVSDDPAGTTIRFASSLDTNPIAGASLNRLTGELTFAPDFLYLDTAPNPTEITIHAHVLEADSGTERVVDTVVQFDVDEVSSFELEIKPIMPTCAETGVCHSSTTTSAGLDLSQDAAFNSIVSIAPGTAGSCGGATESHYVAPGDLGNSLLYQKIIGGQSCGQRMPFRCDELANVDCLSEDQVRKVNLWIAGGALDN